MSDLLNTFKLSENIIKHCLQSPSGILNNNLFTFVRHLCTIGKHTVKIKMLPSVCSNHIKGSKMINLSQQLSNTLLDCPIVPSFRCGSRTFVSSSTMDVKTVKEVRDIVEGSGMEIPAELTVFLEGTTVEMMRI